MIGKKEGLDGYLRRVEQALDCPPVRRLALMEKVRRDAGELFGGRLDVSEEEAADRLGSPEKLSQGLLETLDPKELERYRRMKTLLFWGAVVLLTASLICMGRWAIHLYTRPPIEATETLTIYPPTDDPRGLS